jgi:uncharacterized RDD family membrane protein YckC
MAERLAAARIALESEASSGYADESEHAGAAPRVLAYLIDTAVLFCFAIVFLAAAFLVLFLDTDQGRREISDGEGWAVVAILLLALPAWFVAGLFWTARRSQTPGHFVAGLEIRTEDGAKPQLRRLAVYWLALHPLIFHPILAGSWLFLVWVLLAKTTSEVLVVFAFAMAALCFAVPLVSLVFMLADPQRRAIHDRLAGLRVQRLQ